MSYSGLENFLPGGAQPHLGGSVRAGDPYTYCPQVWDYLISRFCIASVLDLGSGCGNAAEYFFRKGMRVVAIEGLEDSVDASLYPAVRHDLTLGAVKTRVDLVHCQEVVEHVEERYLDHVLHSLACGRICVITHALPGQIGHHHVNLQPADYWVGHMASVNHVLLQEDTDRIRRLAEADGAPYMARTGLVFANRARV